MASQSRLFDAPRSAQHVGLGKTPRRRSSIRALVDLSPSPQPGLFRYAILRATNRRKMSPTTFLGSESFWRAVILPNRTRGKVSARTSTLAKDRCTDCTVLEAYMAGLSLLAEEQNMDLARSMSRKFQLLQWKEQELQFGKMVGRLTEMPMDEADKKKYVGEGRQEEGAKWSQHWNSWR